MPSPAVPTAPPLTLRLRRYFSARRLGHIALWGLALLGTREALGYVMFLAHQSPNGIPPAVAAHLADELRTSGEQAVYTVPVSRKVWWSPRATPGVLVATNRRLIYVGLVPTLAPPPPTSGEVPPTELYSYWLDSATVTGGRSLLTGLPSVTLRASGLRQHFAVAPRDRLRAEGLVTAVTRWQTAQRAAVARTLRMQEEAAELARAPKYYRVKRGDALAGIATQYHVSIDSLQRWNALPTTRIRAGDSLLVKPGT
ncbi:MAG TPA: LysM peptidoglycan-binding domain-containing protein [Gemmatimonadaceae bacterium]|nr:LysM peptidoglycan-binding domain-containing protein [Gemmatimonadaceae bacterium]